MLHSKHTKKLHNRSNIFAVAPFYHPAQPSAVIPFNDSQKCSCSYLYYLHLPINYNRQKYFQLMLPAAQSGYLTIPAQSKNTTRKKCIFYTQTDKGSENFSSTKRLDGIWVRILWRVVGEQGLASL